MLLEMLIYIVLSIYLFTEIYGVFFNKNKFYKLGPIFCVFLIKKTPFLGCFHVFTRVFLALI